MRIGPLGIWEILIIVIIIAALVGGPKLFKRIGRQGKKTLDAAKKGIENGASEVTGKTVEVGKVTKDNVLDGINKMQDKIDEKFDEINEDGTPKGQQEETGGRDA